LAGVHRDHDLLDQQYRPGLADSRTSRKTPAAGTGIIITPDACSSRSNVGNSIPSACRIMISSSDASASRFPHPGSRTAALRCTALRWAARRARSDTPLVVVADLGVDRSFPEPERVDRRLRARGDFLLCRPREA